MINEVDGDISDRDTALASYIETQKLHHVSRSEALMRMFIQDHLQKIYDGSIGNPALTPSDRGDLELGKSFLDFYFDIVVDKLVHGKEAWAPEDPSTYADALHRILWGAFLIGSRGTITESATKALDHKRAAPAWLARTTAKGKRAEQFRSLIEAAERLPNGKLKHPGTIREKAKALAGQNIDGKTFRSYVKIIDENGRTDSPPVERREN